NTGSCFSKSWHPSKIRAAGNDKVHRARATAVGEQARLAAWALVQPLVRLHKWDPLARSHPLLRVGIDHTGLGPPKPRKLLSVHAREGDPSLYEAAMYTCVGHH